jgi:hypothetical protein
MNKKLLLLSLLTGLSFIKADTTYIDTVAELGARVTISEAKIKAYEAILASNKELTKRFMSNTSEQCLKPAASYTWNNIVVPGVTTAGHYTAMPFKYAGQAYLDNWMYTVPATIAAGCLYALYKARRPICYYIGQYFTQLSGYANPGNSAAGGTSIQGNNNKVVQVK